MTDREWKSALSELPSGLTFSEAARRIGEPYQPVRAAIIKFHYPAADGRKLNGNLKLLSPSVDWTQSNIAIARKFKVSREWVRVIRGRLGHPFVESRGRPRKQTHKLNHE